MAEVKTNVAPASAAPAVTPKPENKPTKERGPGPSIFPTGEAALAEANKRTRGHRRAFKVTAPGGKEMFIVAHNPHHAGSFAFENIGGKVEELGRTTRAKATSTDGILAALSALPEDERKKVMEQMSALAAKANETATPAKKK